jgi:1,4-dihydroxy-2-naphthoyl-CoA hydrolase
MTPPDYSSLQEYFQDSYRDNSYVKLLDMKLFRIEPGVAEVTMPVDPLKHTNLYKVSHGGCLASVADTAMGVACGSLGRRVVTLEMNINFLKAADAGTIVHAVGRVIHNGRQTLVVECDVVGAEDKLLAKARGTFYVVGQFDIGANRQDAVPINQKTVPDIDKS